MRQIGTCRLGNLSALAVKMGEVQPASSLLRPFKKIPWQAVPLPATILAGRLKFPMMSIFPSFLGGRKPRGLSAGFLAIGGVCVAFSGARAQSSGATAGVLASQVNAASAATPLFSPEEAAMGTGASTDVAAPGSSSSLDASLPEAPLPQLHKLDTPPSAESAQRVAPLYTSTIPAGYRAQPLTAHDKMVIGFRDLYSWDSLGAIAFSAGYAHIANSQPNYGVDTAAFGQRLGAAAARETSQGVFTEIVLAPLLHEDPRYYVRGPEGANFFTRTFYSVTRPLVTRTDGGKRTVNGALLLGYLGAAALTPAYYPSSNRNFHDVASTYGESIGGAAVGGFVNEFADDVLTFLHLKRLP